MQHNHGLKKLNFDLQTPLGGGGGGGGESFDLLTLSLGLWVGVGGSEGKILVIMLLHSCFSLFKQAW